MKRLAIGLLSVSLLVAASRAQNPTQPKKPGEEPKLQKPQEKKKAESDRDEEETKIFDRLTKNSKKAEERIGKPDLGDETRQVEKDILKDIEELIKRMQQPPQNSDSSQSDSSSSSSSSDSSSSSGGSSSSSGQSSSQPQSGQKSGGSGLSRQERREQRRQQQGKGSSGSKQEKSNSGTNVTQNSGNPKAGSGNPKPMDTGNPMKPDQNNRQASTGGRPPANPKSPPSDSPPSGMYKDVWGHLPEKMRQEMDAYFKERFMPRYSDLLKEYYSTISEQGKK